MHRSRRNEREMDGDDDSEFKVDDLHQNSPKSSWKAMLHPLNSFNGRDFTTNNNNGYTIHPENRWYVAWTHFILIWAVYSSFFTPLEFAFFRGLPENLFLLDIAGQITFLIDIFLHFFVAYRDPHTYCFVYNHNLIAIRYLKSRFLFDLLGCFPWDAIFKHKMIIQLCMKFLTCLRVLSGLWSEGTGPIHPIRLRVTEFFEKLEKDIRINYLFTRIIKLFVVEVYCTHTAACIFYYLATTLPPSKEGYTWIGSLKMGDYSYANFRDIDLWTRYMTSLYFAVVTMATVGYGEIHAVNTREMIFVMMYVSLDMILGAYLLGNMAALIVKGSKTERFRDKMAEIIKYTNRNKLGKNISKEIKGHVRLQYESTHSDDAALHDLPLALRAKISNKLYEPYIREAPLFKGCSNGFIKKVAISVHEEFFLPKEVIVEEGSIGNHLYFLCDGELDEVTNPGETQSLPSIQAHSSIGGISVLCNIPEPHTILAVELSRLLRVEKQALIEAIESYLSDGRTIIDNMLEGKEFNVRNKILESDIAMQIEKHESELAMRLNFAANDGDLLRLRRLVEAGADPNKMDYHGQSALHRAASKGYEDITQYLIEKKVNINLRDNFGNTPLYEAIKNDHGHVASMLLQAGALLSIDNVGNLLCEAVAKKDLDFLKRVLANGVNPNSKNYDLRTPLHLAASEGLYEECVLLLEMGASVFATDRWGKTPIDEARIGGNRNLLKLLEDAKVTQMTEFSNCQDKARRRKCTVFPGFPWEQRDERRFGVVLWVPETIEELIETAKEKLCFNGGSVILSENGGKILGTSIISDDQKLFLPSLGN